MASDKKGVALNQQRNDVSLSENATGSPKLNGPGSSSGVKTKVVGKSPRPVKNKVKSIGGLEYGREEVTNLSQLSDLSEAAEHRPMLLNPENFLLGVDRFSQDAFPEQFLPSQPDIPTPDILQAGQEECHPPASPPKPTSRQPSRLGQTSSATPRPTKVVNLDDNEQSAVPQKTKAARRGPMDEMRQLVRILVKIIPHSVKYIAVADEGGGGNRISEEQIKSYLDNTMGEAPRPPWGVPEGWGKYLADVFSWATGRPVSAQQAKQCAKREPGRSWEAIESELHKLGVYPATWPLPLTLEGLKNTQLAPSAVTMYSNKRAADGEPKTTAMKKRATSSAMNLATMSIPECWQTICQLLRAIANKQGEQVQNGSAMDAAAAPQAEAQALMMQLMIPNASFLPPPTREASAFHQHMAALQLMSANQALPMLFPTAVLPSGYQAIPGMALQPTLGSLVQPSNGVTGPDADWGAAQMAGFPGHSSWAGLPGGSQESFSLSQSFGPSQLLLSQPQPPFIPKAPGGLESAFTAIRPAEATDGMSPSKGVIKPQPSRASLASPTQLLPSGPVGVLSGLNSPGSLILPGLYGCSQGTDIDGHLPVLPQDDFPVITSQDPIETSEDNNVVEGSDPALGRHSFEQSLGTNAMVPEQINLLYRPQPMKPDQARARLPQDVGDANMDSADRQPTGFQSTVNSIPPHRSPGAFRRPVSQDHEPAAPDVLSMSWSATALLDMQGHRARPAFWPVGELQQDLNTSGVDLKTVNDGPLPTGVQMDFPLRQAPEVSLSTGL
eukprot:jgi/Botrbrau1/22380/Bobra.0002s0057.1